MHVQLKSGSHKQKDLLTVSPVETLVTICLCVSSAQKKREEEDEDDMEELKAWAM